MPMSLHLKKNAGFTLVEIIVATGLFAAVMLIAVGSLMSIIDANRKAQSQQIVMNNLSAALESVTRTIRVGASYHCGASGTLTSPQDCAGGESYFAFKPREAIEGSVLSTTRYVYRHNTDASGGFIEMSRDGGSSWSRLTAPEIDVQGFRFYVAGACPKDGSIICTSDNVAASRLAQPRALITIYGSAQISAKTRTNFHVQTSVTQRLFDI